MKKFKKILGTIFGSPLVRGVVKTLPFGNFFYEAAENVKHAKAGTARHELPHSKVSLFIQFVLLALIIYAFVTKQITVDQVLNYLDMGGLWDLAGPDPGVVSDSLNTVSK